MPNSLFVGQGDLVGASPLASALFLAFGDEIAAANRYADLLDRLGVKSIVLLVHQGDNVTTDNPPDACGIVPGAGREIAGGVSPKIDAVFAGHSHQQFSCSVNDPAGNPRPCIQAAAFGRMLSVVDLEIDPRTKDVIRSATVATHHVVTRTVTPDPAAQALVDEAKTKSAPIGNMNLGGVRADLTYASSPAGEGDGVVTYAEAFTVQPFGNVMTTLTLTGAQVKVVLEQQWQPTVTRILHPSQGFTYSWSASAPAGSKVTDIRLGGVALDPAASYRVSVNTLLADGGDGFSALTAGTNRTGGVVDLDAFTAYLGAHPGLAPPALNRITALP